jgi:hypothetical protein
MNIKRMTLNKIDALIDAASRGIDEWQMALDDEFLKWELPDPPNARQKKEQRRIDAAQDALRDLVELRKQVVNMNAQMLAFLSTVVAVDPTRQRTTRRQ